ncbi:MAG: serine O-acetyltransferase EpsC [Eubacteriales bacterium]
MSDKSNQKHGREPEKRPLFAGETTPQAETQPSADAGENLHELARQLHRVNRAYMGTESTSGFGLKTKLVRFISLVRAAMYPKVYLTETIESSAVLATMSLYLEQAALLLRELCHNVLEGGTTPGGLNAEGVARAFMQALPELALTLQTDLQAAYEGDPAARSTDEILYAYPSFEAVSVYRLAHLLYGMQVPLLPRMMTEHAHQLTGIDIHPGAQIGQYFFIDHGTGVVIGETCVIGEHVKLYQGVTLGAKSFALDEHGNPVKGIKRHPNIGHRVVIYAGATILGGDTTIGDGAVIGGNVWLTHSVPPGQIVTYHCEHAKNQD